MRQASERGANNDRTVISRQAHNYGRLVNLVNYSLRIISHTILKQTKTYGCLYFLSLFYRPCRKFHLERWRSSSSSRGVSSPPRGSWTVPGSTFDDGTERMPRTDNEIVALARQPNRDRVEAIDRM